MISRLTAEAIRRMRDEAGVARCSSHHATLMTQAAADRAAAIISDSGARIERSARRTAELAHRTTRRTDGDNVERRAAAEEEQSTC